MVSANLLRRRAIPPRSSSSSSSGRPDSGSDPKPSQPQPQPQPQLPPAPDSSSPHPQFTTLPPEIHLLISSNLIYPDALSLKHTSRYFYRIVDTGVKLKVEWLMERRKLHLECPNNQRCDLGSDLKFCRGSVKYVFF